MNRPKGVLWPALTFLLLTAFVSPAGLNAQGNFVYTNDDVLGPNTVSAFSVAANGTLTLLSGSPFATGGSGSGGGLFASNRVATDAAGKFLFASNVGSSNVSVFTIDAGTGALSLVAGSPFATGGSAGSNSLSLAVTPDGKFLIAGNWGSSNLTVFSIAGSGALAPITGSPFHALSGPAGIKVSPNGKFLAVGENATNVDQVEMFSIAADGTLSSFGAFAGGGGNTLAGVDMDCAGNFLYGGEANSTGTIVDGYSVASNGTLTTLTGSPFIPGVGVNSNVVLLSPDDKTLFVSNQSSKTITVFGLGANGGLSLVAGSPFAMNAASFPAGMATSQDGSFLYVANFNNKVSVFSVSSTGVLTEVTGSPFATGRAAALESLTAFPAKTCAQAPPQPQTVQIMIKPPATPPVPINPGARGTIPVAILSTADFDATTQVDRTSLTFGATGDEASLALCNAGGVDVNGDGLPDLVCHFYSLRSTFASGNTTAFLKGKTLSGDQIEGSEAITIVPPPSLFASPRARVSRQRGFRRGY